MIWLEEQREERLARRPLCADCGRPIEEEKCLPVEDGQVICPGCIRWRMVDVE